MTNKFRVTYQFSGQDLSFDLIAQRLATFFRAYEFKYEGSLELKNGSANLGGYLSTPVNVSQDELKDLFLKVAEAGSWGLTGDSFKVNSENNMAFEDRLDVILFPELAPRRHA